MSAIDTQKVAERKKCKAKTVWDAIRRGVLPGHKVGYSWLVLASDLDKYTPQQRKPYRPRQKQAPTDSANRPSDGVQALRFAVKKTVRK
jgi:excisionase family DNA binding protein